MRGLHEDRNGLGMLGHPLGLAVDFHAYDNPNLKGAKGEHPGLNQYMLKKFGGGRAQMSISEDAIEQLGKNTAAGRPGATDETLVTNVSAQFDEVVQTSENFKKALKPDQMATLRDARNAHFDLPEKQATLARLEKRIDIAKPADQDKLNEDKRQLTTKIAALEATRNDGLAAFAPWKQTLTFESSIDNVTKIGNELVTTMLTNDLKGFDKLTDAQEDELAKRYQLVQRSAFDPKNKKYSTYEKQLRAEIADKKKKAQANAKYANDAMVVRTKLMEKLADPNKVFGQGVKQPDGTWKTKPRFSEVAVMQLLENGFIRNDAMPPLDPKAGRTQVFNAKAAAMLARHGFAPGSSFGDTMHFDFIEGYSDAVAGGRHGDNMKKTRWSPEGDFIPPPSPAQRPKKAKQK